MSEYDSTPQRRPGDDHQPPEQSWQAPSPPVSGAHPTHPAQEAHPAQPVSGGHWHPGGGAYGQGGWPSQPPYGTPAQPQQQYGWQPAGQTTTIEQGHGPSRAGRFFATGAAAVVLAVGSGLLGGVIATSIDDNGGGSGANAAAEASRAAAAPVINRSSLAEIAAKVQPGVVQIRTDSGEGSGVVMTSDGAIVTNNHVVATARGNTVQVIFNDGRKATGDVVGTDPRTDLAVVKAKGVSGLTAVKFGDSDGTQIGDTVLALGSPLDLQGSVTAGIISAKDRTISVGDEQQQSGGGGSSLSGLLQTDAAINPGNSGGALVNTNAELVGINSAIATSGQGSNGNIGIGFAIPSNKVRSVTDALLAGKKVSHPFLGVSVGNGQNGGAIVSGVTANSPAAKAGIEEGDVITRIGDKAINDSDDLVAAVQAGKAGEKVTVTYTRNGAEKTATVTLGEAS